MQLKEKLKKIDRRVKAAFISLAVTVPLILFVISAGHIPTLFYDGMRIKVMPDGSVQLLLDVGVGYTEWIAGAAFNLQYNADYLVPSNYITNEVMYDGKQPVKAQDVEPAFQYNPDLYLEDLDNDGIEETPVNPFKTYTEITMQERLLYTQEITKDSISMLLILNDQKIKEEYVHQDAKNPVDGLMSVLKLGWDKTNGYALYGKNTKIVLGTLSFRVTDPSKLPEITEHFGGITDSLDPKGSANDYLVHFNGKATGNSRGPWRIDEYVAEGGTAADPDYKKQSLNDFPGAPEANKAEARFTFRFPRTIISVEAAEIELSIDAYRAYIEGNTADLDRVLQKYSPTVIVKYSDGTRGSFMMPWGRVTAPWTGSDYYYFGFVLHDLLTFAD